MDKRFLLEYTKMFIGSRHSFHAWFTTKSEMDAFVTTLSPDAEILLMLEIKDYIEYPIPDNY